MQNKFGAARIFLLHLFVDADFIPPGLYLRLRLGQIAPHGEACFRQIQRFAVIRFRLIHCILTLL
ncbi:hypothetical protein D3C85_1900790 [compost metagenome]